MTASSLFQTLRQPGRRRMAAIALLLLAVLLAAGAAWRWRSHGQAVPPAAAAGAAAPAPTIVARGRLEPRAGVLLVSGPTGGGTVVELRVAQGDKVRAGDLLAVLDTREREAAALAAAERDVQLAQLQLAQTAAAAKPSEMAAGRAQVDIRQGELARAQAQVQRSRDLLRQNFISGDALELHELELRRARQNLAYAEAALVALVEVRPVDLQVAQGRVAQASARRDQARIALDHAVVRAPSDGTVLTLLGRRGAALGAEGLLRMADLDQLIVVAEVDERDATRLRAGQAASVELVGLQQPLRGEVARIAAQVFLNTRATTEVLRGRDARVVEIDIELAPGQQVPAIAGAEATVSIRAGAVQGAARQ